MLIQASKEAQVWVPSSHSLTSTHSCPTIAYPSWQVQVKDPKVLVQIALVRQLWVSALHSSTSSVHFVPP